ncbi:hypothetical protein D9M72_515130 [compost metagenome]
MGAVQVPVSEHPAHAGGVFMPCRAVRVSMHQQRCTGGAEQLGRGGGRHIPIDHRYGRPCAQLPGAIAFTVCPQLAGDRQTRAQRQRQEHALHPALAGPAAEAVIAFVVDAQHVAVAQHHALAGTVDHGGVGQQAGTGRAGEALAQQEVPVAVHQVHGHAARGQCAQGAGHALREGRVGFFVADPEFKEVAQDEQRARVQRGALERALEGRQRAGHAGRQVQV